MMPRVESQRFCVACEAAPTTGRYSSAPSAIVSFHVNWSDRSLPMKNDSSVQARFAPMVTPYTS